MNGRTETARPTLDGGVQVLLAAEVKRRITSAKVRQRDVALVAGISEKHLSQMLTGRAQGTLEMWDRVLAELREAGSDERLTFAQARNEIRDLLDKLGNSPHEEHFGPFCPICGLVTALRTELGKVSIPFVGNQ